VTPAAPARAPRRDATENRAALLAAARLVFNRDPEAGLDAVAAEAGLSRRALYGHFATREALQRELIATGTARVVAVLRDVEHPDPVVRLALIAARLWSEVENVRVMTLFSVRGPFQDVAAAELAPLRARLREAVAEAAEAGTARDDMSPELLAALVESSAISVLAEASDRALAGAAGHRLVMLAVLSTLGLGWREAGALVAAHPELGPELVPAPEEA
jgi:AcrR family transcriptional regulator